MKSLLLNKIDNLEADIRDFLRRYPNGGRFILPDFDMYVTSLVIPLMIAIFNEDDWNCEYDNNEECEWLNFNKLPEFDLRHD